MASGLTQLYRFIVQYYSLEDLRTLCFDLGVNYDDLGGEALGGKVRELILRLGRERRFGELLAQLRHDRPQGFDTAGLSLDPAALEALQAALPSFEAADEGSLPALPAPGEPPFKGLQYFDRADAHLFFGREALTAELIERLRDQPFLAVVGASGGGKSSLVRAGLLPALERGEPLPTGVLPPSGSADWPVHVITPAGHPLESLAVSLTRDAESVTATATLMEDMRRDPRSLHFYVRKLLDRPSGHGVEGARRGEHLLLVVDQFEELFTLCRDKDERQAFIDNLMTAVAPETDGPTVLIIALRADFYAYCAQYEDLRNALSRCQAFIGPMNQNELRSAIEEPAARNGWSFAPGLVDLMLRDVGAAPGALPLLSHALLETWKRRQGRVLTLEGYQEAGGVHGAIAKTAERVYLQRLTTGQQAIARHIFLQLIQPGEGTEDTKRRATLLELVPARVEALEQIQDTIQVLAETRLIVTESEPGATEQQFVEVAHEAVIRGWERLREWIKDDREFRIWQERLRTSLEQWEASDRDAGALLRGTPLIVAQDWLEKRENDLNEQERTFIGESLALREQSRRVQRLTRYAIFGMAVTIAVLVALWGWLGVRTVRMTADDTVATAQAKARAARATAEAATTAEARARATAEAKVRAAQATTEYIKNEAPALVTAIAEAQATATAEAEATATAERKAQAAATAELKAQAAATAAAKSRAAPLETPEAGATRLRDKDGMERVYVPAGIFWMGSDEEGPYTGDDETPRHRVFVDAFWIDRTEVTNAQYGQCVEAEACSPPQEVSSHTRENYYGNPEYDDYPVVYVTWHQARKYAEWVGGRLPTEAEWEYACRGQGGPVWPWGDRSPDDTLLNYGLNVGDTTKVGSYPAGESWVGALDMSGNLLEWTQSIYKDYPYDPTDGREDLEAGGVVRVVRGGSFINSRNYARCSYRVRDDPDLGWNNNGFRVVSPISP